MHEKTEMISKRLRLMTYNVHSCIGMDRRISPERIAKVISRHEPDIVALQELDIQKKRTGKMDQPHMIAHELEMMYHFHPSMQVEEERYGNAILSRFPMKLIRAQKLPQNKRLFRAEPRGAIWTQITIGEITLQFINTHLDLLKSESLEQAKSLMGSHWLGHSDCRGPVVLGGDFNSPPNSPVCRLISDSLHDAQTKIKGHRPKATWFGHLPIRRIDHIFVSSEIKVLKAKVSRSKLDRIASDHLPLIVDIRIESNGKE